MVVILCCLRPCSFFVKKDERFKYRANVAKFSDCQNLFACFKKNMYVPLTMGMCRLSRKHAFLSDFALF